MRKKNNPQSIDTMKPFSLSFAIILQYPKKIKNLENNMC